MKKLLFFLIIIFNQNGYSQITFEKGYFIDNLNQKTECLIKNMDWRTSPTKFEYKITENSEKETATIKTVKEFGIYNSIKYIREVVQIDQSSNNINKLSIVKEPEFKEVQLFLKVLIEGKANLYYYEGSELSRFFYSIDNSKIEQLVFKEYMTDSRIAENIKYKQQLWENFKCSTFSINDVGDVGYNKSDLIDFFIIYNNCVNHPFTNFNKKIKKDLFNLNIRTGLNNSSLSLKNDLNTAGSTDFKSKQTFRIGLEAEFILNFNKNKWAFIAESTYNYYKDQSSTFYQNIKVDYTSIELPLGIRHYMFLNKNSKIFINGAYTLDFPFSSKIDFDKSADIKIKSRTNFGFGLGYKQNDKFSFELRYYTNRQIINSPFWVTKYKTICAILGYTLF